MANTIHIENDNIPNSSRSKITVVITSLPLIAGGALLLLSIMVMAGWYTENITLVQMRPQFAPMQFNTALCFFLSGTGVIAFYYKRPVPMWVCGSTICLLATLTLIEYIGNLSLGIDTLFNTPFTTVKTSHIGRMSPNTALCFLLTGGLFLKQGIEKFRQYRFMEVIVCVSVLTLSASALLSYLFGAELISTWGSFSRMAIHTAISFVLLSGTLGIIGWKMAGCPKLSTIPLSVPALFTGIILVMDMISRLGIAVPMLYIFIVLCGLAIHHRYAPFILASVASFLTLLAYMNLPQAEVLQMHVSVNRVLAVISQWVVACVVYLIKITYNELQNSRDQMQVTLLNVFGAIITIDTKGTIQLFNPMAERIFGYKAEEVIGKNIKMLMPEPFHSNHDNYLSNYLNTGKAKIIGIGREVTGLRKDGSEFPLELGVSRAEINNKPIFVGLLHDITARKNAEEEVKRRTEELEYSNHELDDFAYIASHDLKEPLRGIHNYASFLLEDYQDKLEEDGKEKLKTLALLAQRLESLIDSLLYYSRVGRGEMASETTDMNPLLDNIIFSLKPSCEEKNIQIRIPGKLPTITCDAIHVGEVFRNLITNAMKYNDKDEKWIEIGYKEAFEGGHPVFYVKDNGIGIPEKHQESIFRIFKRLHARNKFGGGTGSGLTIAKKIIERHGGTIWIESEVGKGTTFYFTLSRGDSDEKYTSYKAVSSDTNSRGQQRGLQDDGTRVA